MEDRVKFVSLDVLAIPRFLYLTDSSDSPLDLPVAQHWQVDAGGSKHHGSYRLLLA